MDKDHNVINSALNKATNEILQQNYNNLNYDKFNYDDVSSEVNKDLVKFTLDKTTRNDNGRLVMPLMWRSDVCHLLAKNLNLSKAILNSNFKKLKKKPEYLNMIDESFRAQEEAGIISRVDNMDDFLQKHPYYSFLPHMGVFRPHRTSTKCRVVYLSNLKEDVPNQQCTVSHNQAIYSGPCLNQSISTALIQLRFDKYLLIFDLVKAFNQIELSEADSARLLCLWYKNLSKGDFSLICYRNVCLTFGLRCSPTILMLG